MRTQWHRSAMPTCSLRRLPNAVVQIVPGAGHMLLFDDSDKAAAILEPFLAA